MRALFFNKFGGSEVLQYGELPDPEVSDNELLVKMCYIGVNYADIYRRTGTYPIEKNFPYINGYEGVGIVTKIGTGTTKYKIGDRVFFVDVPFSNAELVIVPEECAIFVPEDIDIKIVASIGLQGLTADFLSHDLGNATVNNNVLVRGISGGVGQILSQMLTADGLNVYGITSTEKKRQLALNQGAKSVFLRNSNWEENYLSFFDTVYDGIGITLSDSIDLLKNKGEVIFFGMSGGKPQNVDFSKLLLQSKSVLTGDLWDYLTNHNERVKRSNRLFSYFRNGKIAISEPTIFSLSQGKEAHDFLESGKSVGKILLKP